MPGPLLQLQAVTQETVTVLESTADVFKHGSSSSPASSEQSLLIRNTADKLKADAAKIGVLVGDANDALDAAEMAPLLTVLTQTVAALCTGLHAVTFQAGPSLVSQLKAAACNLTKHCIGLVQTLPQQSRQPVQAAAAVKAAVAQVWDACEAVKKLPLDNKTALFKQLAAALRAARDVLREMDDLQHQNNGIQETVLEEGETDGNEEPGTDNSITQPAAAGSTAAPGLAARSTSGDQEQADVLGQADVDYDAEPLSAAELEVVAAARQVMQLAATSLQQLAKALLPADTLPPAAVEGWESTVWHVKTLQRGLEDLGAAMYGPQDKEEINECAEAIAISLECMLDELPEEGPQLDSQQLHDLQTQLELHKSRLTAALQALPPDE